MNKQFRVIKGMRLDKKLNLVIIRKDDKEFPSCFQCFINSFHHVSRILDSQL